MDRKDVLEDSVDEKYYLSDERVEGLLNSQSESDMCNGFSSKLSDGSRKTDNSLFDFDEED